MMRELCRNATPLSGLRAWLLSLLAGLLLALPGARASTYVGHPVPAKTSTSAGFTLYSAMLHFDPLEDGLLLEDCNGVAQAFSPDGFVDPVLGEPVDFPEGEWCAVTLAPDLPLVIHGEAPAGGLFTLIFDLGQLPLQVATPLEIDAQGVVGQAEIVFAADDWLVGSGLDGLAAGEQLTVGPLHPLNAALLADIQANSALVVAP